MQQRKVIIQVKGIKYDCQIVINDLKKHLNSNLNSISSIKSTLCNIEKRKKKTQRRVLHDSCLKKRKGKRVRNEVRG